MGKNASEIGFVPLAKETIKQIFEKLDAKDIKEIAYNVGSTIPRELVLLTYGHLSFPNVVSMIEISNSRYGSIKHDINHNVHTFTVFHGLNEQFSLFLSFVLEAMAKDLSFNYKTLDMDCSLISIEISENSNSKI